MALSASEKEAIMAARGESNRQSTSATKLYRVTVDGKGVTMLALSGLEPDKAEEYCRGIFGNRMSSFQ